MRREFDYQHIIDYINGRMDETARKAFEKEMISDKTLAKEVAFYQDLSTVSEVVGDEDLLSTLSRIDNQLEAENLFEQRDTAVSSTTSSATPYPGIFETFHQLVNLFTSKRVALVSLSLITMVIVSVAVVPAIIDYRHWKQAKRCNELGCYEQYLLQHPKGNYKSKALLMLDSLAKNSRGESGLKDIHAPSDSEENTKEELSKEPPSIRKNENIDQYVSQDTEPLTPASSDKEPTPGKNTLTNTTQSHNNTNTKNNLPPSAEKSTYKKQNKKTVCHDLIRKIEKAGEPEYIETNPISLFINLNKFNYLMRLIKQGDEIKGKIIVENSFLRKKGHFDLNTEKRYSHFIFIDQNEGRRDFEVVEWGECKESYHHCSTIVLSKADVEWLANSNIQKAGFQRTKKPILVTKINSFVFENVVSCFWETIK